MEEETMTPQQEGMMRTNQQPPNQDTQSMELNITPQKVSSNLEALSNEEKQLITQLNIATQINVEPFRNFMSKIFGPEFGMLMEQELPEPQQQVSPQRENPAPMTGQGMMTQPPSQ